MVLWIGLLAQTKSFQSCPKLYTQKAIVSGRVFTGIYFNLSLQLSFDQTLQVFLLNVKYNFGVEDLYEPAEEYWNDVGKFKVKMPPPAPPLPTPPPSSKSNAKKNKSNKKENKGKSRGINRRFSICFPLRP